MASGGIQIVRLPRRTNAGLYSARFSTLYRAPGSRDGGLRSLSTPCVSLGSKRRRYFTRPSRRITSSRLFCTNVIKPPSDGGRHFTTYHRTMTEAVLIQPAKKLEES